MVEFAIILPILVALIFGLIDFGFVLNDYEAVNQGTSSAAREASIVTTNPPPTASCPTYGLSGASTTVTGLICQAKSDVGLDPTQTRVSVWWPCSGTGSCSGAPTGGGSYDGGFNIYNDVVICTQYPARSASGFFTSLLSGLVLQSKVEIRIETDSTGMGAPAAETGWTSWPASCTEQ